MRNSEYRVGSHITVEGNRGIVEEIERYRCYNVSFNGKAIDNRPRPYSEEDVIRMRSQGYEMEETDETTTYFTVSFKGTDLEGTSYDGGTYGCNDAFECYGTW